MQYHYLRHLQEIKTKVTCIINDTIVYRALGPYAFLVLCCIASFVRQCTQSGVYSIVQKECTRTRTFSSMTCSCLIHPRVMTTGVGIC
jgi:hypothetical protein